MTIFQLIMLAATAFFAYQVYVYIQNIDENAEPASMMDVEEIAPVPTAEEMIAEADQAYMDGDVSRAKTLLEEIVRRYPDFAEGMNKLAFVLAKEGDTNNAERYYRSSLALEPNDDMTHNAMATMLASLDRVEEAQEHYKKALEIDDNYEVTWFNYANLMLHLGRMEEAKEMYEKALAIDPDFEPAREELKKMA